MSSHTLLKLGKSEFKRVNYKNAYISLANFFNENDNKILTINDIQEQWEQEYIYINNNPKKLNSGISRIKSMCNSFGLGELNKISDDSFLIKCSDFSKTLFDTNIINKYNNHKFYGMEFEDFWFFQLILKMKSDNKIILSRLLKNMIKDNRCKGEYDYRVFLSNEYLEYIDLKIKKKEFIDFLLPKSSNSSENKNNKKDETIKSIVNEINQYITNKNVSSLYNIAMYLNLMIKEEMLPDGFYEMFFCNFSNKFIIKKKEFIKIYKNNKEKIIQIISNSFDNLNDLFVKRIIYGSVKSYIHINKNTLNCLPIIFNMSDFSYEINENFFDLILTIINKGQELSSILVNKYYSSTEILDILKIENKNLVFNELENKIQEIYSIENMVILLKEIKYIFDENNEKLNKKEICNVIKKFVHFGNIVDENYLSLYFEYIISLSFLSKYKRNFSIEDLREFLNTKLGSNLEPIWHASGEKNNKSGADAIIVLNDKIILVEPTIQQENIFKMEYESSVRHLATIVNERDKRYVNVVQEIKKSNYDINSFIVSIKYEERIDKYVKNFNSNKSLENINYNKTNLYYFDINRVIEFLSN